MAENESLDLADSRRWQSAYHAVRQGKSSQEVAGKVERGLCGGLRAAFKEFAKKGVSLKSTVSCAHYPLREWPHKQCGFCPACILRRQAMTHAGIEEPSNTYKFDLFGPPRRGCEVPTETTAFLKAFLLQVSKLSELDSRTAVPWYFRRHLLGTGIAEEGESLTPFVDLYRRYRKEWLSLAANAQAHGWSWANLFASRKVAV